MSQSRWVWVNQRGLAILQGVYRSGTLCYLPAEYHNTNIQPTLFCTLTVLNLSPVVVFYSLWPKKATAFNTGLGQFLQWWPCINSFCFCWGASLSARSASLSSLNCSDCGLHFPLNNSFPRQTLSIFLHVFVCNGNMKLQQQSAAELSFKGETIPFTIMTW